MVAKENGSESFESVCARMTERETARIEADNRARAARDVAKKTKMDDRKRARKGKTMVSECALFARINRILSKKDDPEALHRCRIDGRGFSDLGRYYIIDVSRNTIVRSHCDIEDLGTELGALRPSEACGEV